MKIKNSSKGWSKGLTSETDEKVKKRSKNIEKKIINKNYRKMTKEKAYILGVLCGDGYIGKNNIGLKCIDKDFIDYFSKCLESTYGIETAIYFQKSKSLKDKSFISKDCQICILNSKRCKENILSYSKHNSFRTKEWEVPKVIYNSKNDNIKGMFVRGFFDSEGNVAKRNVKGFSTNLKGISQIKDILNELGIVCRLSKMKRDYEIYEISICGKPNLSKFLHKVGFSIKRKRNKLFNELAISPRYNQYSPTQYKQVIELKQEGIGKIKASRITGINVSTVSDWMYRKRGVVPFCVRYGEINLKNYCNE